MPLSAECSDVWEMLFGCCENWNFGLGIVVCVGVGL